jgi:hypothetical protein
LREQERAAEVVRRVAIFLRTLTDKDIDDLVAGRVRLTLAAPPAKRSTPRTVEKIDIEALRRELSTKATREDGMSLLDSLGLTRESLRQVAATLDIPTPKTDTVARLKDRIIEATIGYRLRSEAIRNTD